MLNQTKTTHPQGEVSQKLRHILLSAVVAVAGLFGSVHQPAVADGSGNADVQPNVACMEDTAGFGLNCTANDVQLAAAKNITILDDGCAFPGDDVTFTAEFEILLTAQARHDIGIWFAQDGDPNGDGALTGTCTAATPAYAPDPPWLDLDGTNDPLPGENKPSGIQDTCGDIDADHNPLFPEITLTVACIDPDQDGKLNLPNCTSWRQSGANDLCVDPIDAFPGSPSKCRCDTGFNIDIDVPSAELEVTKTADPTSVNEPGGSVTFTVTVTNTGIDPNNPVTLNSLNDDIYNDITTTGHDGITATTCSVPQVIPADDGNIGGIDTYTCTFTADVTGDGGDTEIDTVTAAGEDDRGNPVSGSDDATVTINDVLPDITVLKTAVPTTVLEPGGAVTFSVLVTNNSVSSDPVTITSLTDDVHGNLSGQGDCTVPQVLAGAGGTYSCSFTADVTGNYGYTETDTVTASGADDEGNPVSDADSATVMVLNVPSSIELIKTVDPTQVEEPGGNVTYTFTVNNTSPVDTVTITSLTDDILVDLDGQGTCAVPQILAPDDGLPGGPDSYTCTVIAAVTGNAFDEITNTATAVGVDDDGEPVMASDSATVDITNAPPLASLTKTATEVLVTYAVEVCNDSDAEALTLDALGDDIYGDITDVANPAIDSTTCVVSQNLAPAGDASGNDCYSCSFMATTTTSPTTDTVTGTVNDDDGSTPVTPSDSATVSFE
jgi:uncharacterized repeat protein (TIGR01451 family)